MRELIDKAEVTQKLCAACYNTGSFACISCEIPKIIKRIPAIVSEPVLHGQWIPDRNGIIVCSLCRYPRQIGAHDFCGKCGAKMDGGADNG